MLLFDVGKAVLKLVLVSLNRTGFKTAWIKWEMNTGSQIFAAFWSKLSALAASWRNLHVEVVGFALPAVLKSRMRSGRWSEQMGAIPVKPDIASVSSSALDLVAAKCLEIGLKWLEDISRPVSVYVLRWVGRPLIRMRNVNRRIIVVVKCRPFMTSWSVCVC